MQTAIWALSDLDNNDKWVSGAPPFVASKLVSTLHSLEPPTLHVLYL